jgi:ATPases involved in chromosome partitioning
MEVIAVANQKGGVGKTPTTVNLGAALVRAGYRVLLVDLDPQGSLTEYFLAEAADQQEITVYNAIMNMEEVPLIKLGEKVDLLPAHDELSAAEIELPPKPNAHKRLAKVLTYYTHDFALLDCPPSLGVLTLNALAAANKVLIPVKTELAAQRTLKLIRRTIGEVQKSELNKDLKIWKILPTLYDMRKGHHVDILRVIQDIYGDQVYPEPSKDSTKYNDACTLKTDVSEVDKKLGEYWDRMTTTILEEREVTA